MWLLSTALQVYAWGFAISLAFFILVMVAKGVGSEGYTEHIAACIGLALTWPYTWTEIVLQIWSHYHGAL